VPSSVARLGRRLCLICPVTAARGRQLVAEAGHWRAPHKASRDNVGMPRYALGDKIPDIDATAFIHPDAVIIGDVRVGPESSVWPTAVLRGDHGRIVIGARTSIQDGTVIHCTADHDTIVGDRCVVGHNAHLEGCTVGDDSLIGSGAVVLNGAHVGPVSLIGAGAVVSPGTRVPSKARALGVPARVVADVVEEGAFDASVLTYVRNTHWYRAELRRLD
jgi:carbonic anhydrase/acetyltransferase-like protein (isoleucine patch superfamily)